MTTFTQEQFAQIVPDASWYDVVSSMMDKYEINTPEREAAFLAQICVESNNLTALHENLNYSAEGLMRVFHKYFPSEPYTRGYVRKPENIANKVYANRFGNGPEESGDGWKYRGRGAIQITFHDNYKTLSEAIGVDMDSITDYLETREGAIESACWYWTRKGLNELADIGDFDKITLRINGGMNGSAERHAKYQDILDIFNS